MKKILLSLSLVGLVAFNSCKDEKKATATPDGSDSTAAQVDSSKVDSTATASTDATATPEASTNTEVPKFADAEVQEYVNSYSEFVKGYLDAVKNKDTAKLTELATKAQEFGTKGASVAAKLQKDPEAAKQFAEYTQKLAKEYQDAMMNQGK